MVNPLNLVKPSMNILKGNFSRIFSNSNPIKLTISLTNKCNKLCKICNVWHIYRDNPQLSKNELTLSEYKEFFSSLHGTGILYMEFTGGEPFLREDLSELVIDAYRVPSLLFTAINTNGYDSNSISKTVESILRNIPSGKRFSVGISVDGNEALHDELKGVSGSWRNAVQTFMALNEMRENYPNLSPHFSYTLNQYNFGEFQAFYTHLSKELSVSMDDFSFSFEQTGLLWNNNDSHLSHDSVELERDLDFILSSVKPRSLYPVSLYRHLSYLRYLKGIPCFLEDGNQLKCSAMILSAFLDPYGNLYPCIPWEEHIGNIRETSFHQIWNSVKSQTVRKRALTHDCPTCWTPCEVQPSLLLNLHKLFNSN